MKRALLLALVILPMLGISNYGVNEGAGGGGGSSLVPAQASAPADPSAGFVRPWWDTANELFSFVESDSTDHVLLERQAAAFPAGSLLTTDGQIATSVAGVTVDPSTGVITAPGLVISNGGVVAKTYNTQNTGWGGGNIKSCADLGGQRSPFNSESAVTGDWGRIPALNAANPFAFHSLTINLISLTTDANFATDETMAFGLWSCPTFGSTPTSSGCTLRDKIVFEDDATPDYVYGTTGEQRTAVGCDTRPCLGSIAVDGTGLEPQGTVSFTAGTVAYWMLCVEQDDADFSADGGSSDAGLTAVVHAEVVVTN